MNSSSALSRCHIKVNVSPRNKVKVIICNILILNKALSSVKKKLQSYKQWQDGKLTMKVALQEEHEPFVKTKSIHYLFCH